MTAPAIFVVATVFCRRRIRGRAEKAEEDYPTMTDRLFPGNYLGSQSIKIDMLD